MTITSFEFQERLSPHIRGCPGETTTTWCPPSWARDSSHTRRGCVWTIKRLSQSISFLSMKLVLFAALSVLVASAASLQRRQCSNTNDASVSLSLPTLKSDTSPDETNQGRSQTSCSLNSGIVSLARIRAASFGPMLWVQCHLLYIDV